MLPDFDLSLLSLQGSLGLLLPITALLPLVSVLMVCQDNPYQALMLRGVFGSASTLLFVLLGAPDVALTEAMVGTLLSTTLYVIALRSSMTLRLEDRRSTAMEGATKGAMQRSVDAEAQVLRHWIQPLHLRLRLVREGAAPHGWLEDQGRLTILQPSLKQRLQNTPGFKHWCKSGGVLITPEEPTP